MSVYKLTYFSFRARGEVPRQLLHLSGVKFEDNRIERSQWPQIKPTTPFGQIPVLSVNGKELSQSGAIIRYLAQKFGYAGKDDWEKAQVDALTEQVRDFLSEIKPGLAAFSGLAPGDKEKALKESAFPARDKLTPLLEKILKNNKSGFLVGDGLTYADLLVVETWTNFDADFFKANPAILEHRKRVQNHPKLKDWIEKRPKTQY